MYPLDRGLRDEASGVRVNVVNELTNLCGIPAETPHNCFQVRDVDAALLFMVE
jgi:hypothetical protein